MKIYLLAFVSLFLLSCKSKSVVDPNLPKDISTKPISHLTDSPITSEELNKLRQEILAFGNVKCMNSGSWKYVAVGSKACGGPEFYAVYPVLREQDFLSKVNAYSTKSMQYNMENNVMSDCSIVPEPNGVKCEEGKIVLQYGNAVEIKTVEVLKID